MKYNKVKLLFSIFINHLDLENNEKTSLLKNGSKKRLICKCIFRIRKTIKKTIR